MTSGAKLALAFLIIAVAVTGAPRSELDSPPVELPRFVVKGDSPWRYAKSAHFEILSIADDEATSIFVRELEREIVLLETVFPEGFLLKNDVPSLLILHEDTLSDRSLHGAAGDNWVGGTLSDSTDYDVATFFVNVAGMRVKPPRVGPVEGYRLTATGKYLKWVLDCKKPTPPSWLGAGLASIIRWPVFCESAVKLAPMGGGGDHAVYQTMDTKALVEGWRGHARLQKAQEAWKVHAAQFVMWGLGDPNYTEKFWEFVRRASEQDVTQNVFQECLDTTYRAADGRAYRALMDFMKGGSAMLNEPKTLSRVQLVPDIPFLEFRPARGQEVGRILGEWRRQAAKLNTDPVARQAALLAARDRIAQYMPRANADARYLAALGLCERDAGQNEAAFGHLEAAVQAGVVRPRAYLEYARLLHERRVRAVGEPSRKLTPEETRAILAPLLTARAQSPALEGVHVMIGRVWSMSVASPGPEDLAIVEEGTRLFPYNAAIVTTAAKLHEANGLSSEAAEIVNRWLRNTGTTLTVDR